MFLGYIRSLRLQLPWKYLGSQPVVITIDGVFAVASARQRSEQEEKEDAIVREKHQQAQKMQRVALYELYRGKPKTKGVIFRAKQL